MTEGLKAQDEYYQRLCDIKYWDGGLNALNSRGRYYREDTVKYLLKKIDLITVQEFANQLTLIEIVSALFSFFNHCLFVKQNQSTWKV